MNCSCANQSFDLANVTPLKWFALPLPFQYSFPFVVEESFIFLDQTSRQGEVGLFDKKLANSFASTSTLSRGVHYSH